MRCFKLLYKVIFTFKIMKQKIRLHPLSSPGQFCTFDQSCNIHQEHQHSERYLRIATVMASAEVAHGQMASVFRPWLWNRLRKASQDDTDPEELKQINLKAKNMIFIIAGNW